MGTSFSDILTLAMSSKIVNDINWQQEMTENAALFFRQKSQVLLAAIPKFNRPPQMKTYLSFKNAEFDAYTYIPETDSEAPVTVQTGKTGYQFCNCGILFEDKFGCTTYSPVPAIEYDAESGAVTIPASAEKPIAAGTGFELDFYTDGAFDNDLDYEIQEILCLCLSCVWEFGFSGSWLDRTPTVQDKTFKRASTESAWTSAQEQKRRAVQTTLNDRLAKYEQNIQYRAVAPKGKPFNP